MDSPGASSTGVPISYLEAYPYPSCVIVIPQDRNKRPQLKSRDTDVTVREFDGVSPLSMPPRPRRTYPATYWANEKWLTIMQGKEVSDRVDEEQADGLYSWAERENVPTPGHPGGESVFLLRLPGTGRLSLAKTILPLSPPSSTHAFCVITSQQSEADALGLGQRRESDNTVSPGPRSSASSDHTTTSYFDTHRPSDATIRSSLSSDAGPSASERTGPSPTLGANGQKGKTASQVTKAYSGNSSSSTNSSEKRRNQRRGNRWEAPSSGLRTVKTETEECWAMVNSIDWSKTCMGPRANWADVIDPILSLIFESRSQDCLWLGEDLHMLYNTNYIDLLPEPGHPYSFGKKGSEVWSVLMDLLQPVFEGGFRGESTYRENDLIMYDHLPNGELCERYFSWRYNPVKGSDGTIIALYNQATEVTDAVIAERRLGTVRDLSEHLLVARSTREYYDSLRYVFEYNQKEAPFMLAYSVKVKSETVVNVVTELRLETSLGVPTGHPSAPPALQVILAARNRANFGVNADKLSSPTLSAISVLSSGSGNMNHVSEVASWPIGKALQSRQPVIVDDCRDLIRGYVSRAWDMLPMSAIVVPICSDSSTDVPDAVIILGLNVRRPYDADYDGWIHVVRSQLTNSLTAVKAAEAETERRAESDRMERAKAAWFRGAAHDLRSPLTLVAGPLDDVLGSTLTHTQRSSLGTAKRNVDRLLRLVNTLMDFSRVEAGRMEGQFVPLDLGVFVSELAVIFRPAVERLKIEYHISIEASPHLVYVDPSLLETVISNLIGNAIKYTESGSITVRLTYGEMAEISVIDTGTGIPRGEVHAVTEWYHRATTAIHSGTQGSGLGLALAREFLHLHGGELTVTSKFGPECNGEHGSVFTAQLPLTEKASSAAFSGNKIGTYGMQVAHEAMRWVKPTDSDTDTASNHSDTASDTYTNGTSRSPEGSGLLFEKTDTILLVEDSLDMRNYIKQIFSPYCTVIEAKNGEEGLKLAIQHQPNVILSDYMMPKMTGMEMLRAIRQEESLRYTPFVLTSAVAGEEIKVDALLAGAEDYIPKPFKPKELLARVHLQLQLGKKRVKLEMAYEQRQGEISVLSDYCPTGIMRGDIEGHITYANNSWREMAGMPPGADPDTWTDYTEASVVEYLWPLWTEWLRGDEKELTAGWRWLSGRKVSARFVRLDRAVPGMAPGVLGCITDVTHEEERLAEAEKRRIEAEESKHQQELLIDLTSHEIRTPVSAILQCSSLVKENLVSLFDSLKLASSMQSGFKPTHELLADIEEDIEALESIYQCGLVQERIAGDILSLARIQLDMLSLHDIGMDVRTEARKVLSVFASEAKMKKIELALEFGETFDVAKVWGIKTDPVRLGQVVTNLISNAIRFTAASDVRKITVRYEVSFAPPAEETCALPGSIALPSQLPAPEDTDIWLFVSVRDTGPGLGPKELALLFKRFSQGNKMIHTRYGGSGLGLFICRKITELLGGRIEVQSQLGDGSVFRFFIKTSTVAPPVRPALSVGALAAHNAQGSNNDITETVGSSMSMTSTSTVPKATGSPPPEGTEHMHILIVEDNIINQTVLKRQIIKAGLTCDVANNGLEALNLVRETDRSIKRGGPKMRKRYDCVLMDLEMPVMDGLTAIREIRKAEKAGTLARNMVIALTGNARQGQIDQALEAGMDDVVIKPYVLGNLLKKIKAITIKRLEIEVGAAFEDK